MTRRQTGGSFILEYILSGAKGTGKFTEIYRGQKTQFKVYAPTQGTIYKFRVKARNIYGEGPFSTTLLVRTASVPATMEPIKSLNTGKS